MPPTKLAFPPPDLLAEVRASPLQIRVPAACKRDRGACLNTEWTLPESLPPSLPPGQQLGQDKVDRRSLDDVPKRSCRGSPTRGSADRAELVGRTVTDEPRDLDRTPRPHVQGQQGRRLVSVAAGDDQWALRATEATPPRLCPLDRREDIPALVRQPRPWLAYGLERVENETVRPRFAHRRRAAESRPAIGIRCAICFPCTNVEAASRPVAEGEKARNDTCACERSVQRSFQASSVPSSS